MESIEFIFDRLVATSAAASAFAPIWEWEERSAAQFVLDIPALDSLRQKEGEADLILTNAAGQWDAALSTIATQSSLIKKLAVTKFRHDEGKSRMWRSIDLVYNSRNAIYRIGGLVRDAWKEADIAWVPEPGLTHAAFATLVGTALKQQTNHQGKLNLWRQAAGDLAAAARACEQDCIHWYRDASAKFGPDTANGQTLRSTVPTTTKPVEPVGQAVLANPIVASASIHFDCDAPHATRFTYLHRPPGVPSYFVLASETAARNITLTDQPPGEHSFKAIGHNSRGTGPESEPVSVTVAQAQVA